MKVVKLIVAVFLMAIVVSCNSQNARVSSLESEIDSVSYSIGADMAKNITKNYEEIKSDLILQGYEDALDSTKLLIPFADMQNIIRPYFQNRQQVQMEKKMLEKFGQVKEDGIKFLEENKIKEGVVVTESGLQYIVLKEGTGDKPSGPTSNVEVHYHGTTPEGIVFDSSVDKGTPVSFDLNRVVKGWTEALQLMSEGSKYKFFIPQELAYGTRPPQGGNGPIKPFMPLVFEVELIKINK